MSDFLTYFTQIASSLALLGGGLFALVRWADQRKRELEERRFEQYWKLIEISQESIHIAKQNVAIMLLCRYPEYKYQTVNFLNEIKKKDHPWLANNQLQVESVLRHFS